MMIQLRLFLMSITMSLNKNKKTTKNILDSNAVPNEKKNLKKTKRKIKKDIDTKMRKKSRIKIEECTPICSMKKPQCRVVRNKRKITKPSLAMMMRNKGDMKRSFMPEKASKSQRPFLTGFTVSHRNKSTRCIKRSFSKEGKTKSSSPPHKTIRLM
jgi:hypothetical protein